jgi:hypothetical protein
VELSEAEAGKSDLAKHFRVNALNAKLIIAKMGSYVKF